MRLSGTAFWRILVLAMPMLAAFLSGTLSLRCNRFQSKEERGGGHRSDTARLIEEAECGDPEALTNLSAALLTHRRADPWLADPSEVSITLEALVAARNAIAQSPELAPAHFNLAVALARLGLTAEARVEFQNAAILESDAARSAEALQRARQLRSSDPLAVSMAATSYIRATASPASRAILKEYLAARERTGDRSQWHDTDVDGRLEKAAKLYDHGVSSPELLTRVFSQVAMALGPRGEANLYMQRYLIAGGLHRLTRKDEAIAVLRTLDADVFRAHGQAGRAAQIVCEEAIHRIVRDSPSEALDLLRGAFHRSAAQGEPKLTALYANLAREVRTQSVQAALGDGHHPTARKHMDMTVFSTPNGHPGGRHECKPCVSAANGDRLVKYGDVLDVLEACHDVGANDASRIAQSKQSPVSAPPEKSPGEAQRALTLTSAIVEYATVRDQVIAFVIRRSDVQGVFLYASAADVKSAADAMRRADDENFTAAAGRLYELILGPVAKQLEDLSTVAFIPYRDLGGIPFGALLDVQRGQFLIERFAVIHAHSTRAVITASRALKPAREQKVLAIAATDFDREHYPGVSALPAARGEAGSIANLSGCARLMVGPAATPAAIQQQLVQNVVIHYAGHIVRRGADVWLPLMPAAGRDGLSATEIARLPLKNARVVVLAACRGASPDEADEAMPTMADAFLTAGVPAVIASSYDVGDADAPVTMHRLHTYLHDGDDAAHALRKTAIDELRRGRGVPLSLRFMAIGGATALAD